MLDPEPAVTKNGESNESLKLNAKEIRIPVGNEHDGYYPVIVGRNLTSQLFEVLPTATDRVLVIHPTALKAQATDLLEKISAAGKTVTCFSHPEGEAAKTINVVEAAWQACADAQLSRTDTIVAIGGGATTDMAGFVAATWLRGINLVNCPTTLLAMVDAAVGGKTGINTPTGKNLVGSFYPPVAVLCDLNYLATLPVADLRAGLGEVLKTGYIYDPQIISLIRENHGQKALDVHSETIKQLVARSVAVKSKVVSADLKEGGLREILNYGHTLAHAIEKATDYQWRHGEAVAAGMVYAAMLAQEMEIGPAGLVVDLCKDLDCLGLPQSFQGCSWKTAHQIMASDKKVRHGQLRFVLLKDVAEPIVENVTDLGLAERVYQKFTARNL